MKKLVCLLVLIFAMIKTENTHFFQYDEYHREINNLQTLWKKSGYNKRWEEFTLDSIKSQMGMIFDEVKLPEKDITLLNDLPEHFDSRDRWPECQSIRDIRDQSVCGSCWAFGAAEAMSDRLCIQSQQTLQIRISTEDLLACCGLECGFGCKGGRPSSAWNYFKKHGIVTGALYNDTKWCQPYAFPPCDHHTTGKFGPCGKSQSTPKCSQTCTSESGRDYTQDKIYASEVYSVSGEQQIMSEIYLNGPVEGGFIVHEDFLTYKSGVYRHTAGGIVGAHAIKILGWGVENGNKYWLIANSWNEEWGDKGTFKMVRGENHLKIEHSVHAGQVNLGQ